MQTCGSDGYGNSQKSGEILMCYGCSYMNNIWAKNTQKGDICPSNNGTLVPTVFDNSWFINGICFHSSVWGSDWLSSVETPGIKFMLWGNYFLNID